MELLNVIRRMVLREKLPIRQIARRIGLLRNAIKKYLNSGTVEPKFVVLERTSKLYPYANNRSVNLRVYPDRLIIAAEGQATATQALKACVVLPALLHVLVSAFLKTSRRPIVASVTIRFSGVAHFISALFDRTSAHPKMNYMQETASTGSLGLVTFLF